MPGCVVRGGEGVSLERFYAIVGVLAIISGVLFVIAMVGEQILRWCLRLRKAVLIWWSARGKLGGVRLVRYRIGARLMLPVFEYRFQQLKEAGALNYIPLDDGMEMHLLMRLHGRLSEMNSLYRYARTGVDREWDLGDRRSNAGVVVWSAEMAEKIRKALRVAYFDPSEPSPEYASEWARHLMKSSGIDEEVIDWVFGKLRKVEEVADGL